MQKMLFILDESGAKGYSDRSEREPGELGVIAGYLIPQNDLEQVKYALDLLRLPYIKNGKVHVTDLKIEQQETIRNDLFKYFRSSGISWLYEATYVQGFFENARDLDLILQKSIAQKRSNIKISRNKKLDMLHVELFQGAFGKAIAFCIDKGISNFELEIITDRTDEEILEKFKCAAEKLLNVGKDKIQLVTGYNPDTDEIVKGGTLTKILCENSLIDDMSGIVFFYQMRRFIFYLCC